MEKKKKKGEKKVASWKKGGNFSSPENSEGKSIEGWQNGEESRRGEIGCGKGEGEGRGGWIGARGDYDARRQPSWRGRFSLSSAEPAGERGGRREKSEYNLVNF